MSAFGLGSQVSKLSAALPSRQFLGLTEHDQPAEPQGVATAIGALAKFVPQDAMALYLTVIGLLIAQFTDPIKNTVNPVQASLLWQGVHIAYFSGILLTAFFYYIGFLSNPPQQTNWKVFWWRLLLVEIGYLTWALAVVPQAATQMLCHKPIGDVEANCLAYGQLWLSISIVVVSPILTAIDGVVIPRLK
jgi:hypothetical protein